MSRLTYMHMDWMDASSEQPLPLFKFWTNFFSLGTFRYPYSLASQMPWAEQIFVNIHDLGFPVFHDPALCIPDHQFAGCRGVRA